MQWWHGGHEKIILFTKVPGLIPGANTLHTTKLEGALNTSYYGKCDIQVKNNKISGLLLWQGGVHCVKIFRYYSIFEGEYLEVY